MRSGLFLWADPFLAKLRAHTNELVSVAGMSALGDFGTQARPAATAVRSLLNSPEPLVRKHAANTLKKIASGELEERLK